MRVAQIRVLGGAMARVDPDATAFAHRDRQIMVNVAVVLRGRRTTRPRREAWVTDLAAALHQRDGAYVNFLADEGRGRHPRRVPGPRPGTASRRSSAATTRTTCSTATRTSRPPPSGDERAQPGRAAAGEAGRPRLGLGRGAGAAARARCPTAPGRDGRRAGSTRPRASPSCSSTTPRPPGRAFDADAAALMAVPVVLGPVSQGQQGGHQPGQPVAAHRPVRAPADHQRRGRRHLVRAPVPAAPARRAAVHGRRLAATVWRSATRRGGNEEQEQAMNAPAGARAGARDPDDLRRHAGPGGRRARHRRRLAQRAARAAHVHGHDRHVRGGDRAGAVVGRPHRACSPTSAAPRSTARATSRSPSPTSPARWSGATACGRSAWAATRRPTSRSTSSSAWSSR